MDAPILEKLSEINKNIVNTNDLIESIITWLKIITILIFLSLIH